MKTSIANQLKSKYNGTLSKQSAICDTVETTDAVWQVCVKDWEGEAKTNPLTTYVNALDVGEILGQFLAADNYNFIHFIAHSAGSRVADVAANWIVTDAQINGKPKTLIHSTFLDAFDPAGETSTYGQNSDWAEQYVDSRLTGLNVGGEDDTRIKLLHAYNFDVTALDPEDTDILGIHAHQWPYKWYQYSVDNPYSDDNPLGYAFGFKISKAYGANPSHNNMPRGKRCIAENNLVCSEEPLLATEIIREIVIDVWLNYIDKSPDLLKSPTGVVTLIGSTVLKLINGSPVWITVPFELTEPINFVSFDHTFQQTAEGLLSVFFDGQLVYRADQRLAETGMVYHSGDVPVGNIKGGTHSLSFRLDAYNDTKSEIDITNVKLGNKQNTVECLLNWAESNYPELFSPSGAPTAVWSVYTYRYYSGTNAYVGVSSDDNHAYYLGSDGILQDEGPLSYWLPKAGCQ